MTEPSTRLEGPRPRDRSRTMPAAISHLLAEHETDRQQSAALRSAVAAAQAAGTPLATTVAPTGVVLNYLNGPLERRIAKEEGPLFPRLRAGLPADERLIEEMVAEHDLIRIKRDLR
jgi:iron-sulfur cluster repair protein YtfE (RIC family)